MAITVSTVRLWTPQYCTIALSRVKAMAQTLVAAATYGFAFLGIISAELLPPTELVSNCYNFPQDNFDFSNCVKCTYGSSPHLMLDTGASAVDFTLHDIEGQSWNLQEALERSDGKPVALIWGMSTCPAYQGLDSQGSSYRWTYWDEYNLVSTSCPFVSPL